MVKLTPRLDIFFMRVFLYSSSTSSSRQLTRRVRLIKQELPCVSTDRCERQMYAAGVARLCATSTTNKEIIVAAATIEPLVGVLLAAPLARGVHTKEQAAQEAAGACPRLDLGHEGEQRQPEPICPPSAEVNPRRCTPEPSPR